MAAEDGFFAEPDDTLWMRLGRPFTAGEADHDAGLFPPTPWSWQGMVRSRILLAVFGERLRQASRSDIESLIGPPDTLPRGWVLQGPLPAKLRSIPGRLGDIPRDHAEPWLPWPAFLSSTDPERPQRPPVRSRAFGGDGPDGTHERPAWFIGSSSPHESLLGFPPEAKPAKGGWLSARNLCWALLGEGRWDEAGATDPIKRAQGGADLPPFIAEEPRSGLEMDDKTGRAKDHMLYTALHHRFAPSSGLWGALLGADRAAEALRSGSASLGRKGRTLCLSAPPLVPEFAALLRGDHLLQIPDISTIHLRVLLLTPAVVERDGVPPFKLDGARILGQQSRRGPDIGGFDRYGGGGRPVRSTWAAGSWWWVRIEHPERAMRIRLARIIAGLVPDHLTEAERLGFGLRVVAPFSPQTGEPLPLSEPNHG